MDRNFLKYAKIKLNWFNIFHPSTEHVQIMMTDRYSVSWTIKMVSIDCQPDNTLNL